MEIEKIETGADLKAQNAKVASLTEQLSNLDGQIRMLDLNEKEFHELKHTMATISYKKT